MRGIRKFSLIAFVPVVVLIGMYSFAHIRPNVVLAAENPDKFDYSDSAASYEGEREISQKESDNTEWLIYQNDRYSVKYPSGMRVDTTCLEALNYIRIISCRDNVSFDLLVAPPQDDPDNLLKPYRRDPLFGEREVFSEKKILDGSSEHYEMYTKRVKIANDNDKGLFREYIEVRDVYGFRVFIFRYKGEYARDKYAGLFKKFMGSWKENEDACYNE